MSNSAESTINERLKLLMQVLGVTPAALAKVLDASDSTVRNYIYRDTKPGYDVLEKLYRSFRHINLPWLFGEPGEPLLTSAAEPTAPYETSKKISRAIVVGGNVGGNATNNQGSSANEQALERELEFMRLQLVEKERTIQILLNKL